MTMAYALGYDPADLDSDEEDVKPSTSNGGQNGTFGRANTGRNYLQNKPLPSPLEMDEMDTRELERLEWMEPLGYRALSEVTRLPTSELRRHFWATMLKTSSPEYQDIQNYFQNSNSHGVRMRIKRVVNLKRFNENNCDYKDPSVQLLWHGTSTANVASILTNGFRLPMSNGMFGRGVYFADRVSKSQQYCRVGVARGTTGVLFLCAVNLGKVYQSSSAMNNLTSPPAGFDSVQGVGHNIPDPKHVRYYRGAKIPCGRTVVGGTGGGLQHNEFIVYDLRKIAILFFVEFEYV